MKLKQIENEMDPIIFERGAAYRENNHILSIHEIKPNVYHAEVVGSELYEVEVHLDSYGELSHLYCVCSYDGGPICKHTAAVLLEIRDQFLSKEKVQSTVRIKSIPPKSVADHLSKLNKDELITLILNFAASFKEVEQELSLKFMEVDNNTSLNQYKK